MKRLALLACLLVLASVPAAAAGSDDPDPRGFPGANGRIAFGRFTGDEHWLIFSILENGTGVLKLTSRDMNSYTPAWASDGTKLAYRRRGTGAEGIWTMKSNGAGAARVPGTDWTDGYPAWSPDGTVIAYADEEDDQVWRIKEEGGGKTQVTKGRLNTAPAWSPDGTLIAFMSKRDGDWEVFVTNADGSGNAVQLTDNEVPDSYPDWSPDGLRLAFQRTRNGDIEIFTMDSADGKNVERVTNHLGTDRTPAWSPNGNRIVYAGWDGNDFEIYTILKDGTKRKQVTNNTLNDYFPDWEPA